MSILNHAASGVEPGSSPVRPVDPSFEAGVCPLSCTCPACQAESDWIEYHRYAEGLLRGGEIWEDLTAIAEEEDPFEEGPLNEIDYAFEAGYELGYHLQPADPPRAYSDAEVVAWFGGYAEGQSRGICDLFARMDREERRLRDRSEPDREWHESEIRAARSNGGHPAWEDLA